MCGVLSGGQMQLLRHGEFHDIIIQNYEGLQPTSQPWLLQLGGRSVQSSSAVVVAALAASLLLARQRLS